MTYDESLINYIKQYKKHSKNPKWVKTTEKGTYLIEFELFLQWVSTVMPSPSDAMIKPTSPKFTRINLFTTKLPADILLLGRTYFNLQDKELQEAYDNYMDRYGIGGHKIVKLEVPEKIGKPHWSRGDNAYF